MNAVLLALYVFCRLTGLLLALPMFSAQGVPRYVLVLTAVGLTVVLAPIVPMAEQPSSFGMLVVAIACEVTLGLLMGTVVTTIFGAMALGAEVMASQIGQGTGMTMNPITGNQGGPLAQLASWLSGMVFLSMGVHLYCLRVLGQSFEAVPAGTLYNPLDAAPLILYAVSESISLGARLAGPVLGLVWTSNLFVGILVRLAPRMNIYFSVGSVLTSVAGLILFTFSLPVLLETHSQAVMEAAGWLTGLLELLRG